MRRSGWKRIRFGALSSAYLKRVWCVLHAFVDLVDFELRPDEVAGLLLVQDGPPPAVFEDLADEHAVVSLANIGLVDVEAGLHEEIVGEVEDVEVVTHAGVFVLKDGVLRELRVDVKYAVEAAYLLLLLLFGEGDLGGLQRFHSVTRGFDELRVLPWGRFYWFHYFFLLGGHLLHLLFGLNHLVLLFDGLQDLLLGVHGVIEEGLLVLRPLGLADDMNGLGGDIEGGHVLKGEVKLHEATILVLVLLVVVAAALNCGHYETRPIVEPFFFLRCRNCCIRWILPPRSMRGKICFERGLSELSGCYSCNQQYT